MKPKLIVAIFIAVFAIASIIVIVIASGGMGATVGAAAKSYMEAYNEQKDIAYENVREEAYNIAFDYSEKKHHVSSEYSINIDKIREIKRLEVLEVSGTEYMVENGDENKANITCWLEVTGKGIYTVDLETAEYLVDKHRCAVTVRLPKPVLTSFSLDKTDLLEFKNDFLDDGNALGTEMFDYHTKEAYRLIHSALSSDPDHVEAAQKSAQSLVESLVKSVNSDYPDIKVDVEFF